MRIFQLDREDGVIKEYDNLKRYISNYYKGIFEPPKRNNFSTVESQRSDISQVSEAEKMRCLQLSLS